MQTGDLAIGGLGLLLLLLLCVRLALRRPDPQQELSLEELEKNLGKQEEQEVKDWRTHGRGAP